jgi:tetratricopeptide (TPR) repeat protein
MRVRVSALFLLASAFSLAAQVSAVPASTPSATDNLAKAHEALEHDRPDEAIAILKQMAQTAPATSGVDRELGLAYYRTGKLVEAKQAFADAMVQDAQDVESVQMEGLTLYRMGQPAAAIPFLERVRQWTPDAGTDANYVLGLCYLNAGRYDEARASFAAQFQESPDSGPAWLLLATMLNHANLSRQAATEAQKALQVSPDLPLAHYLLGEVALLDSNINEAISQFEAEQRINPSYAPVYERLGDAYLRVNNLDLAQQALTKALSLDMSSTGPFILMGRVLLRRQDAQTAIMYLLHAEKMDPGNYVTHASLAQAYRLAGQEDAAKRENELAAQSHLNNDPKLQPVN